jgi:hypothetical protein
MKWKMWLFWEKKDQKSDDELRSEMENAIAVIEEIE